MMDTRSIELFLNVIVAQLARPEGSGYGWLVEYFSVYGSPTALKYHQASMTEGGEEDPDEEVLPSVMDGVIE